MKSPAFQFYADDFLAGTFSMTNEERGLYITLLCRQWTQGYVTPDEVARLGSTTVQPRFNHGSTGVQPEGQPWFNHVLTKFQPDENGNLRNARLEAERAKQNAYRLKQSARGKASVEARRNRGSTVVQPAFNHGSTSVPTGSQPEANSPSPSPSPSPIIQNPLSPLKGEAVAESVQPEPQDKPVPNEPKPKGKLQLRAEALMRRRPTTPLTTAESRAFTKNRAAIEATTEEDWATLERFYAEPQEKTYARKDLTTLLNNWNGEIDRAKLYFAQAGSSAPSWKPQNPDDF